MLKKAKNVIRCQRAPETVYTGIFEGRVRAGQGRLVKSERIGVDVEERRIKLEDLNHGVSGETPVDFPPPKTGIRNQS